MLNASAAVWQRSLSSVLLQRAGDVVAHRRRPARTVYGSCTRRALLPRCRARDPLARAPIRRHLHARGGVGLRGTMQGGVARRGELGRQPGHAPAQRGRSRRHPARQRRCLKCLMISAPSFRPARLCGGARGRTSACPSQPAREASSVSDTLVGRSAGQGRAKRHGAHLTDSDEGADSKRRARSP